MLYLATQIGLWLALTAVVFFIFGLWMGGFFRRQESEKTPSPASTSTTPKGALPDPIIRGNRIMNINKAVDKANESKSLKELCDLPVDALQGISAADAEKLKTAFGIKSVRDLANCKYFIWAQAIVELSQVEE